MSQGFDVESKALRAYARGTRPDIERVEKIRNKVDQLDLSAGTFGKLPESDELKSDYDEKQRDSVRSYYASGSFPSDAAKAAVPADQRGPGGATAAELSRTAVFMPLNVNDQGWHGNLKVGLHPHVASDRRSLNHTGSEHGESQP